MAKEVEGYMQKQKSPQKETCQKLRKIILGTFPQINEEMRVGVPWYGGKFYIVSLKDHVNLGFAVKGLSREDMKNFEGKGKLMRHLKFFSPDDIDEKKATKLLKLAMKKAKCDSC
jgi:hypothetical protein